MKVKALQRFPYEGRQVEVGDEFDIPVEIHVRIFEHKGYVTIVKDEPVKAKPPPPPPAPVEQTALKSEDAGGAAKPMTTGNTAELMPVKRTYKRRDMKPET
jgi:hypothetical protein